MKNKSFALKAAVAGFMLLGASISAMAASATTNVGVQLNAIPAGTCTVTPAAASFALPAATVGQTYAAWEAANLTVPGQFNSGVTKTSTALNQTFNLVCGSTVSILSIGITPVIKYTTTYTGASRVQDSTNSAAWGTVGGATGMILVPELVSVNGSSSPFSFADSVFAAVPYSSSLSVGTTPVPVVWRVGARYAGVTTATLAAPASVAGYTAPFLITVNY